MNVFIINANERTNSYSSNLMKKAIEYFRSVNDEVMISDLYQMNFNPVASGKDFVKYKPTDDYKLQKSQLNAVRNDGFAEDISAEMEKVKKADLLIFNFPLWWDSMPAIMKGWIDRVFAMGFAYGGGKGIYEKGPLRGKKALLTITTGGGKEAFGKNSRNGSMENILFPIVHGIIEFVGMEPLPPFIVYGASRISDSERIEKLNEYSNYLAKLGNGKPATI